MNFEKKLVLIRALKKAGITSAKALSDVAFDSKKLLALDMSKENMIAVVDLAEKVGKVNPFFDWFLADA
jgi:hypothetical protein